MPMSVPRSATQKYSLLVLAGFFLLLGGVGIYIGSDHYPIRALGATAILASVYVVRLSRSPAANVPVVATRSTNLLSSSGPERAPWIVSLAMVPLLGAAWFLLHMDAANGGHQAWPVDVFAAIALVCCVVWSYLFTKIRSGGRR